MATAQAQQRQMHINQSAMGRLRRRREANLRAGIQDLQTTEPISYKIALTRAERESAFRLVYKSYVKAGLTDPNSYQMRVSPYHLLCRRLKHS